MSFILLLNLIDGLAGIECYVQNCFSFWTLKALFHCFLVSKIAVRYFKFKKIYLLQVNYFPSFWILHLYLMFLNMRRVVRAWVFHQFCENFFISVINLLLEYFYFPFCSFYWLYVALLDQSSLILSSPLPALLR